MKNLVLFLLVIIWFGSCKNKDDRKDILNVLEHQRQAWNSGYLVNYMQGYAQSDSLVFIGKKAAQNMGGRQHLKITKRDIQTKTLWDI